VAGDGRIEITAEDRGPGIPDVSAAMTEGFSTANEWIRSLGFGAGMGLPNSKRVSDDFHIDSGPGRGTRVRVLIRY
jgi:anti-sigma regulatory factor (Ser/Thr protein kinase)